LLDAALAKRAPELRDVKIRGGMRMNPLKVVEADPAGVSFCYNSWHQSGYERKLNDAGQCFFIPMIYRNMPRYYRQTIEVDVAFMALAPMDDEGYFSASLTNSATKAIAEKAKILVVEVNENLPRIADALEGRIHISEVDYVVESGRAPLPFADPAPAGEVEKRIAEIVLNEIVDGATIQLGVGGLPNAVGSMIADSNLKDLAVHTEMLVDAYMIMDRAGKITNRRKNINTGNSIFSFCYGSQALYDWAAENGSLRSAPINYVNEPHIMSRNDNLVTINNCVAIDLYGQVSAESAGARHISGTGGQLDFLTGGFMSRGGKSFICFTSPFTDKKSGNKVSRILPAFDTYTVVTDPRSLGHYLVTEWGLANIAGCTVWERAERIIGIAHPDFRDELAQKAAELKIWRRSNKK
jgi:acyl-CoA hydrolase